jgi:hypothetical protein
MGLGAGAAASVLAAGGGGEATGLGAAISRGLTLGGNTAFGSSDLIFCFSSACFFRSPAGSQPRSTGTGPSFSFTTFGAIGFDGFCNCDGAETTSLSP